MLGNETYNDVVENLPTTLGLALLGQTNIASTFVLYCASVRA